MTTLPKPYKLPKLEQLKEIRRTLRREWTPETVPADIRLVYQRILEDLDKLIYLY